MNAFTESQIAALSRFGGACAGEHRMGSGKRQFMSLEHGERPDLMMAIKPLIDPGGLMNPGAIFFPDREGEA